MSALTDEQLDRLHEGVRRPDLSGTRYEMREKVGEGGMGAVFRVRDQELGRDVALKVVRGDVVAGDAADRLVREARIIAGLEHPGIVPVHDVGTLRDGRLYYVMKLVRGQRLDEALGLDTPLGDRLRAFQRICETVAFAHAHGVIHRDLKPQNVMVGAFGEILVLDWGVAKIVGDREVRTAAPPPSATGGTPGRTSSGEDTRTRATATGVLLGTPAFMAPEQARGEVHALDKRTDVFALGAILYFLLTGRAPAEDAGGLEGLRGGPYDPPSPRAANPSVPRPLASICRRALAGEPGLRYAGADELAADVARFLNRQPVTAHRETVIERAARLARNYRTAILLVLAYLLMRVLLILWDAPPPAT